MSLSCVSRVSLCVFSCALVLLATPAYGQGSKVTSSTAAPEDADRDHPLGRDIWFQRGREPLPGHTAAGLRYQAHQQKVHLRAVRARQAITAATPLASTTGWTSLGPAPLQSNAGTGQDYGAVTGRANAVLIDPADSTGNTVYVGGAFGGLWRSTNAANPNASSVTWTPLTDDQPTLSFGSIAIQPNNTTGNRSNLIILGTGESNAAIDSYYGLGFLRSTDAGNTWTLIPTANNGALSFKGLAVARMAFSTANTNTVVAAVTGSSIGVDNGVSGTLGIYTSTDAGATWTHEIPTDSGAPISANSATAVVYNATAGRFFAAIRYHGIYSSPDGVSWTRLPNQPGAGLTTSACPTNGLASCPLFRGELAVVPGRNEMYVWYIDSQIADRGIWRTINGGTTWSQIDETGLTSCGDTQGCGTTQAFFNMTLAAVPSGGATDLYAGAVNQFKCPSLQSTNTACGAAGTWLNLTHVYGCNPPGSIARVHPDEHAIDFKVLASNQALIFFANDGGIYRALDGFTDLTTGTCGGTNGFDNLNGTLGSMTQFVSMSQHPSNAGIVLGGTQDNGSPATNQAGTSTSWFNVYPGDGGYSEINPTNANEWFTANTDVSISRCTSGTSCNFFGFNSVVDNSTVGGDTGPFYTPYILDPQSSVSELLVGTCRVWRGPGVGGTFVPLSNNFDTSAPSTCTGTSANPIINQVRSIAAGGPTVAGLSNVVYATTEGFGPLSPSGPAGGRVFRTLNAASGTATWADVTGSINPNQYTISSAAIDSSDGTGQTAYVALMGFGTSHVFKTANAGATWADFSGASTGALPSAPANTLVIDLLTSTIYVGTDVGVFSSSTTAPNWTEVGPNSVPGASGYLPNVPVTKLRIFRYGGQKLLRASTYGRGIWQYNLAPVPDFSLSISNSSQTIYPAPQQTTLYGVLTALNTYVSTVALSCTTGTTAPPATCTLTPASLSPLPTGTNFSVTAGGTIGDYIFNVHALGTDAAAIAHDQSVTLKVVDFALTTPAPVSVSVNRPNTSPAIGLQVTASGSFNSAVNLTCSGLPAGASCTFSPASVNPTAGNPAPVSLTIATSTNTPAGTYSVTVAGIVSNPAGTRTQSLSLNVTSNPDFSLIAAGGSQSTNVNQALTLAGTLTAQNGYARSVNISCTGNPPATCSSNPATVTPTATGVPFTVTVSSAVSGTFNFNITAIGTDALAITHSVPVSLTVNNDFTLSNGSGTQTVLAGQTAAYSLSFAPVGASTFGAAVTYFCSGLPAGASCTFSPTSIAQGAPATTVVLSISTLGPNGISPARGNGPIAFALLFPVGLALAGTLHVRRRKRLRTLSIVVAMLVPVILLLSCGGAGTTGGAAPPPPISVTVDPTSKTLFLNQVQQFTATVSNTTNTQVTWQVNGVAGGSVIYGVINNSGLYTAPANVPSPATFNVTAIAQADSAKSASSALTIQAPTPAGTYNVTITATSGAAVHTATAVLVVQ